MVFCANYSLLAGAEMEIHIHHTNTATQVQKERKTIKKHPNVMGHT